MIFITGISVLLINIFFYQICFVHGESMNPTLKDRDITVIKKYNLKLSYGDILVIRKDNKIIIKRLVGLPGDKIRIDNYLYVNDKKMDNLYTENKGDIISEILLKENEYFVLGDNRQNSIDSRFEEIGTIKKDEIIGKLVFK